MAAKKSAIYDSKDVIEVAGISNGVLQSWLGKGAMGLRDQNPGPGNSRRYTANEVAQIRLAKKFSDQNYPLPVAFMAAKTLGASLEEEEPAPRWLFCGSGNDLVPLERRRATRYGYGRHGGTVVIVSDEDFEAARALFLPGAFFACVDVDVLVKETAARLDERTRRQVEAGGGFD